MHGGNSMKCENCNSEDLGYEQKNETENTIICFNCGHMRVEGK